MGLELHGSLMSKLSQPLRAVYCPHVATVRVAACLAAVLCVGVASAAAARRTTIPGVVQPVFVTLTNTSIKIPDDKFSTNGHTQYPRGAIIDFVLSNHGTKAVSVKLKAPILHFVGAAKFSNVASAGAPIAPGHRRHFRLSFFFRGSFTLEMLLGGKVRASHPIIVF
jgi:hypothetical protein